MIQISAEELFQRAEDYNLEVFKILRPYFGEREWLEGIEITEEQAESIGMSRFEIIARNKDEEV